MTSVMLKECCLYAKENQSKLYACFLDVQTTFDKLWQNGLFLKLYNRGIRSNLLRVIINLHCNMTSCVIYNGHYSSWFRILQGSSQGGIVSPFMYLCYIDDLIRELCKCMDGFMRLGLILYALTVADDMLLLSLSKAGLENYWLSAINTPVNGSTIMFQLNVQLLNLMRPSFHIKDKIGNRN